MSIRFVIAGESQCKVFDEVCVVAEYLEKNLPNICYDRIEIPVTEWEQWLCKINQKNKWHHLGSPIIWKELLIKGSKAYYIGGSSEFLEYCHSYYKTDLFLTLDRNDSSNSYSIFKKNLNEDESNRQDFLNLSTGLPKTDFTICISGTGFSLAMYLISGLLDMAVEDKKHISRIYIYDNECSEDFMNFVEKECSYIGSNNPCKVVKVIEKLGMALTQSDLFIILNHVPFDEESSVGKWLDVNKKIMQSLALVINASASRNMYILFPNIGPACYNATILMNNVLNIPHNQIVVATSDLGMDIAPYAAEIAEVPLRNMFCPPVWGFVGINHLVDIRTTVHKYNSFEPYSRYTKVKNSSLSIGSLTPELRTMEYLMYFDETLWIKVAEHKEKLLDRRLYLNKAAAVLDLVKLWLLDPDPDNIVNVGLKCDGSFGLMFEGAFSQPARLENGKWKPAGNYMLPRDAQMQLSYLEQMAKFVIDLKRGDLPKIKPYHPCCCKPLSEKR